MSERTQNEQTNEELDLITDKVEDAIHQKPRRDWFLTISVEAEGLETLEELKERLGSWKAVGQKEQGKGGFVHWQLYIYDNPKPFSTIKRRFPKSHISVPRSAFRCYRYVTKDESSLGERFNTGVKEPRKPASASGNGLLEELHGRVIAGASVEEILREEPLAFRHVNGLREVAAARDAELYGVENRKVTMTYVYGGAGVGKTWHVFDKEGTRNLYRVSNYRNPWDRYAGQSAVLLDEYAGQLPLEEFLQVTDVYPVQLRARYADRWAGFSRVYILSNLPPEEALAGYASQCSAEQ